MSSSTGSLQGKVALVTGAGRGIGASVARSFARAGAKVVVNDLGSGVDGSGADQSPAEQVAGEIRSSGGQAIASATDVTNYGGCKELIDRTVSEFGSLDILVNAAGILRDRMIFNMEEADWDAVVAVHLKGTFNMTRHAASYWRSRKTGVFRLINFTSGAGLFGVPSQPNYAAAKMGILGLTLSCSNSLTRYGVTSNAIAPVAGTRMTISVKPETYEAPIMSPDNVAPAVNYVASDASSWLNGKVIWVSGGRLGLVSLPKIEREIISRDHWTDEVVAREFEQSLRPFVEGRTLGGG